MCLRANGQAVSEARLVRMIANARHLLFDRAVVLAEQVDIHKLLIQLVVAELLIENLRGALRNHQLMLVGCLEVVQSQLLLLGGVPIAQWLSLGMLVVALTVDFEGAAY